MIRPDEKRMAPEIENEIRLADYIKILVKRRRQLLAVFGLCVLVSFLLAFFLPKQYLSKTSIMPLSPSSESALLKSSLADPLQGFLGAASGPANIIMAILESRTLAERVIRRLDLISVFFPDASQNTSPKDKPTIEDALKVFKARVNVEFEKKRDLINILVKMNNPNEASTVAQAVVGETRLILSERSYSTSKNKRIFIEEQLKNLQKEMLLLSKFITEYYSKNRVSPTGLLDINLSNHDQKFWLTSPASPDSPSKSVGEQRPGSTDKSKDTTLKQVPQKVYLDHLVSQQEVMRALNGSLLNQYSLAQIDEAKEDLSFEVIDDANTPIKAYWPKKSIVILAGIFLGLLLAVFSVFGYEFYLKLKLDLKNLGILTKT